MILAAHPPNMQIPYPHSKDLKIDTISDVRSPRILSNFDPRFFEVQPNEKTSVRDDIEAYVKFKKPALVSSICDKLSATQETIGDTKIPCSATIHATVLYVVMKALNDPQLADVNREYPVPPISMNGEEPVEFVNKDYFDFIKQLACKLDDATRQSFLNCIVNELRYPNSHTY
jgi:hypothetical protein